jgi:hypothetical protein
MCSIIASFSSNKLKDLYTLNSYRGSLSYSFAYFTLWEEEFTMQELVRGKGVAPDFLFNDKSYFTVCHSQAPTTQASNIHPAVYRGSYLWHNGIVKQKTLVPGQWDTIWLLQKIKEQGWDSLSEIDGTFACILYNNDGLYVFRNEISPMYYDSQMNFSSTKFENSQSLIPNHVFKIDLAQRKLISIHEFKTFENPYFMEF